MTAPDTASSTRTLVHVLRPAAGRWFALGLLVAVASGLALAGPLVVRAVIDRATAGAGVGELQTLAVLFLAIAVARQLVEVVSAGAATVTAWRTTNEFRLDMTRHVLGLDHEFHRRHTPGELIQRVDGDITSVNELCSRVLTRAVGSTLLIVGMIVVVAVIDWRIGIGMAAYVGLAILVLLALRHRAVNESAEELGALADGVAADVIPPVSGG